MPKITQSQNSDVAANIIEDIVPERMIKVYPYEFIQTNKSEAFIKQNAVTLAHVSQEFLDKKNELLIEDENGAYYFKMIAASTSVSKLDISTSTSVYGQELKEEDEFTCLSNWFYEGELKDIQLGDLRFMPAMFTIGKSYDQSNYENGIQAAYIPSRMIEAKESELEYPRDINQEGLYEFTLVNITTIESVFPNVRIIPTSISYGHVNFYSDNSLPKIKLETNNSTLFNHVKLRASYKELPNAENKTGNVDLYSMNNISPIMFSTTAITNNIELYCDWFNYDNVMPWVYAQNFAKNATETKHNQLESFMSDEEDVKLIYAMLYTTAAFADSFSQAPRIGGSGSNSDKIKPDFKIFDLSGVAIEGKDPVKVIDGLYEKHIRAYPEFLANKHRTQKVNMILTALSRFIYSSHSIGKGQNSFNSLYLPWFLEPMIELDYTDTKDSDLTFQLRTNYYKTNFSSKQDFSYGTDFDMPARVNLSSQILLRSDRPSTLPQIEDTITAMNKLPLAGDINTNSSDDLKNLYFVQIANSLEMEKLFVNDAAAIESAAKNETKKYPPFELIQPLVTEESAIREILIRNPGWISVDGTVPLSSRTTTEPFTETAVYSSQYELGPDQWNLPQSVQTWKWPSGGEFTKHAPSSERIAPTRIHGTTKQTVWTIGESTLIKPSASKVTNYSVEERQLIYDKQEWQSFLELHAFNLNHNGLELEFDDKNTVVTEMEELIIGSVWADYMILTLGANPPIRIPMFNKDDETIGIQRIIFS